MTTSAVLLQLLTVQAQIDELTARSIRVNNQYDANHTKVAEYEKYQTTYDNKYDKAINTDTSGGEKTLKVGQYHDAENIHLDKGEDCSSTQADIYARSFIQVDYDEQVLYDLQDIDEEFDAIKTLIESQLETLKAQKDKLKTELANEAQDTHTLE